MVVLFSLFILSYFSLLKFKSFNNPVIYFLVIHYLHNLSFSTLKNFDYNIFWIADKSVGFDTINIVKNFNLISMWIVSILFLLFIKKRHLITPLYIDKKKNQFSLFIYLVFSLFLIYLNRNLVFGDAIYGADQALSSSSAFNPYAALINFRIYFILYYIIFNNIRTKSILFIIVLELTLSFILGERKDLGIMLFGILIFLINVGKLKLNFKSFIGFIILFATGIVIPIYRSFIYETGLLNKLSLSYEILKDSSDIILYYLTGFANSEGVQNWTFQLIEANQLKHLYGLSYIQGVVNTIILRPFQPDWLVNSQAAYYFKNIAYPYTNSTGYDFSFSAEAILNFGIYGGYFSYFLLALFIIYLYNKKNKTFIFLRLLIWPVLLISFRTDSTALFRLIFYIISVPFLIKIINSIINVRHSRIT